MRFGAVGQNIELVEHSRVRRLSGPLRSFPHGAENIDFIGYGGGVATTDLPAGVVRQRWILPESYEA